MAYQSDFSSINIDNIRVLGEGMLFSLEITGTVIPVDIAWSMLLVMMCLSGTKPLQVPGQVYVNFFRPILPMVMLLWLFLIVPQVLQKTFNLSLIIDIRMTSALVVFALFEAAYYSEITHVGIQSVSRRQTPVACVMGMAYGQVMCSVILLQVFRNVIPLLLTQATTPFQDTSLVYVGTLSDFFTQAYNIGERDGRIAGLLPFAGLCYSVICFGASVLVKQLQKKVT